MSLQERQSPHAIIKTEMPDITFPGTPCNSYGSRIQDPPIRSTTLDCESSASDAKKR